MITDRILNVVEGLDEQVSPERPVLRQGQITNQDQIYKGQVLVFHGPGDIREIVTVIRGPFRCGGGLCLTLAFKGGYQPTFKLATLSVVRYQNCNWNVDCWLGIYKN